MDDKALQEAQRVLEQKRAALATSTPLPSPLVISPGILRIVPTSGEEGDLEPCELHKGLFLPCEECRRQAEEATARRTAGAVRALKDISVGARYQGMGFNEYQAPNAAARKVATTCQRYAETFSDRLKNCDNILMFGNPGTGKNMLSACICQSLVGQGYSVLHTTALKLVRRIKESWGKGKDLTEQQAIDQFSKPDLLVIDEVGIQFGSDTEKILLFEVINERYENMRPTVVISNLTAAAVEEYLGSRVMDRFHEGKSAVLEFTWDSYRRRK